MHLLELCILGNIIFFLKNLWFIVIMNLLNIWKAKTISIRGDPAGWLECKSLATSKISPLDQLCTTSVFAPHVLIPRKNLKKTKWRHCGRSRSDTQVSGRITKNSERISQLKEPCVVNLSVLESILKAYLKSPLSVPYIPELFLSPDSYSSRHVAHIQLYTCHHLELPQLERYFYSFRHSTKLSIQGVTWCTAFLRARPL